MNLKKIPPEKYEEVAKAVIDCSLNFRMVAKRYGVSELVVVNLFQRFGKKLIEKTEFDKQVEDLNEDFFSKQKSFLKKTYDVKIAAIDRIYLVLENTTDIEKISKMLDIIDKITEKNKDEEMNDPSTDNTLLKL